MVRLEANSSRQLNELVRIVHDVDNAPDLERASRVLVRQPREFMNVDVCTVYITSEDEKRHLVVATEGLSSHTIGNLECGFGKGLIGLVAESLQPLNLEQVPQELDRDFLRQIGECLSAIDIGQARMGNLVGIISGDGSPLSHAAILARALVIAAVMGVAGLPLGQLNGQELVVDGTAGQARLRLSPAMQQAFDQAIADRQRKLSTIESVRGLEAITVDGVEVDLFINAGLNIESEAPDLTGSAGSDCFVPNCHACCSTVCPVNRNSYSYSCIARHCAVIDL